MSVSAHNRCPSRRAAFTVTLMVCCAFRAKAQSGIEAAASAPWTAPARSARVANPVPVTAASIAAGRRVYKEQCATCHGVRGRGDGPLAANLLPPPGNITLVATQKQSDGALYWKITVGRNIMPAMSGALSETERWSLVNYLRTLKGKR